MKSACVALAAVLCLPGPALAGEAFLGVYAHDIHDGISIPYSNERGEEIIGGYRTSPLESLHAIGQPQFHLLGAVNTAGGLAFAAAGLSWRFNLVSDRLYLRPGIGVGVHDGDLDFPSPNEPGITAAEAARRFQHRAHDLNLGSRVLFEPELALGWRASDRVAFELSWIHMSHAQLAGRQNPGIGDFGLRAVYRFGGT